MFKKKNSQHKLREERECSVRSVHAARVEQVSDCSSSASCVSILPSRILQVQLVLLSGAGTHSSHMRDSKTSASGETSLPSNVAKLKALIEIFYSTHEIRLAILDWNKFSVS